MITLALCGSVIEVAMTCLIDHLSKNFVQNNSQQSYIGAQSKNVS